MFLWMCKQSVVVHANQSWMRLQLVTFSEYELAKNDAFRLSLSINKIWRLKQEVRWNPPSPRYLSLYYNHKWTFNGYPYFFDHDRPRCDTADIADISLHPGLKMSTTKPEVVIRAKRIWRNGASAKSNSESANLIWRNGVRRNGNGTNISRWNKAQRNGKLINYTNGDSAIRVTKSMVLAGCGASRLCPHVTNAGDFATHGIRPTPSFAIETLKGPLFCAIWELCTRNLVLDTFPLAN